MPNLGGMYQGMWYWGCSSSNPTDMDNEIITLQRAGQDDRVCGLFYFPHNLLSYGSGLDAHWIGNAVAGNETIQISRPSSFQGYEPRNKKLFTFPFMQLSVDCLQSQKSYKWEKAMGIDALTGVPYISFTIYGALTLNPALVIVPDYDNINNNLSEVQYMNFCDGLVFNNTILLQLFGERGITNKLGGVLLSGIMSFASPNLAIAGIQLTKSSGELSSTTISDGESRDRYVSSKTSNFKEDLLAQKRGINDIIMKTGQQTIHAINAQWDNLRVRGSGGNYDYVTGAQEIYFKKLVIKREFAEKIDKFFDCYGYAVNTIKTPSLYNRPLWTYVKTKGCIVGGAIPDRYRVEICNIFDSGIRFWNVAMNLTCDIGNYNQDNSPLPSNESNGNEEEENEQI